MKRSKKIPLGQKPKEIPPDLAESVEILRARIAAADRGAKGIPVKRAFAMIRKRVLAAGARAHKIGG